MKISDIIRKQLSEEFGNSVSISKISSNDIPEVLEVCVQVFSNVMSPEEVREYVGGTADWNISVKATMGDKIVGCYIFNEESVTQFQRCSRENLKKYKTLKGIQGVGLAVLPEFRGTGVGKKLRDYPLHLNYDYIWGQHLEGLHNVDNWVKFGRRVIGKCGGLFITLMDLKNNISERVEQHHQFQQAGHTCGPTCVQMVADYIGVKYKDFEEIENLCGCNTTTGTVDTGIKNALEKLNIRHHQNTEKEAKAAFEVLNSSLVDGNVFIMRTLTRGIKHWIVVYKFDGTQYYIADPWLGKIQYTPHEILKIWRPREFDGFTVFK